MCNCICQNYPAKRLEPLCSLYINNVRCAHCEKFINRDGIFKGKWRWRCKCCGGAVRFTPYAGRKSINYGKVKGRIENVLQ